MSVKGIPPSPEDAAVDSADKAAQVFVEAVGRSMDEMEKRIVEVTGIENGDDAGLIVGRVTFSPEVERARKGMFPNSKGEGCVRVPGGPFNRPNLSLDELLDAFDKMDAEGKEPFGDELAEALDWTDPEKEVPTPTTDRHVPLPPVPEGTPAPKTTTPFKPQTGTDTIKKIDGDANSEMTEEELLALAPKTGETLGDGLDGGGKRMNAGKLRIELVPPEWFVALADVMTQGSKKYEPRNWEKGMKWSTMIGSMKRHIAKFEAGERYDGDGFDLEKGTTGCHHLAMIAWNALALMTYDLLKKGTNDLPDNDGLALLKRVNAETSDIGNSIHDDDK